MTVTDDCDQTVVKDETYTVPTRPTLVAAGPESVTKEACASTSDFAAWKAAFQYTSGGCNYKIKYEVSINGGSLTVVPNLTNVVAPSSCGGSVRIKMTVTDDCDQTVVKEATYTITKRLDVTTIAPKSITKDRCDLASDFNTWKALFSASGGCSPIIKYFVSIDGGNETEMTSIDNVTAPGKCGGSVKIRIVITDDCDQSSEKEATYTITKRLDVTTSAPQSITKDRCDLASDFNTWKAQFAASGGCGAVIKYFVSIDGGDETEMTSIDNVTAPGKCGGSVKIRIVITDDCSQRSEKEATYTITKRLDVTTSAPQSITKDRCDLASDFNTWKAQFSASGGCSPIIKYFVSIDGGNESELSSISSVSAPGKCGGSVKIRIVITDDCSQRSEKEATYTITKRLDIVINSPDSKTVKCLLQDGINTEFAAWLAQFNTSGGCSSVVKYYVNNKEVANLTNVAAPSECGGTVTIKVTMTDDCSQSATKTASFEAIPKPVGLPKEKTIYSCIAVDVDLPDQIKCNVPSTFKWYSVASVGSATSYDNPNIEGETFSITTGTNSVINDVLTNVGIGNQTIIYRVVPTSNKNCIG
jgi:hypothetical protein